MSNYSIEVALEALVCRDTESIHSSDKFALPGAVFTDTESAEVMFPTMRINDGETRLLQSLVFQSGSQVPKVGPSLQAWDIDENESWIDNEAEIKAVSAATAQGGKLVPKYGTVLGLVLDGVNEVVPTVVDQFIDWDDNDQLLLYSSWTETCTLYPRATLWSQGPRRSFPLSSARVRCSPAKPIRSYAQGQSFTLGHVMRSRNSFVFKAGTPVRVDMAENIPSAI